MENLAHEAHYLDEEQGGEVGLLPVYAGPMGQMGLHYLPLWGGEKLRHREVRLRLHQPHAAVVQPQLQPAVAAVAPPETTGEERVNGEGGGEGLLEVGADRPGVVKVAGPPVVEHRPEVAPEGCAVAPLHGAADPPRLPWRHHLLGGHRLDGLQVDVAEEGRGFSGGGGHGGEWLGERRAAAADPPGMAVAAALFGL